MSLPAGVTSFELIFGKTFDFEGTALRTDLVITPSHELVWAATGDRLVPIKVSKEAAEGEYASVQLPHTDQAGFVDLNGAAITDWWYTVQSTDRQGRTAASTPKTRKVQATSGVVSVDLDLIPTNGTVGPVGSAPLPAVLSVNGQTGSVTIPVTTNATVAAYVAEDGDTRTAIDTAAAELLADPTSALGMQGKATVGELAPPRARQTLAELEVTRLGMDLVAANVAGDQKSIGFPQIIDMRGRVPGGEPLANYYRIRSTDHAAAYTGSGGLFVETGPTPLGPWTDLGRIWVDTTASTSQTEAFRWVYVPHLDAAKPWYGYYSQFGTGAGVQSTCLVKASDPAVASTFSAPIHAVINPLGNDSTLPGDGHSGYFTPRVVGMGIEGPHLCGGGLTGFYAFSRTDDGITFQLTGFHPVREDWGWTGPAISAAPTFVIGGSPTGGTYTLTVNGLSSAPIAYNASNATIQAAIDAIGAGVTVVVTGTTTKTLTFPRTVSLSASAASLTGGTTPTITVAPIWRHVYGQDSSADVWIDGERFMFGTASTRRGTSPALSTIVWGPGGDGEWLAKPKPLLTGSASYETAKPISFDIFPDGERLILTVHYDAGTSSGGGSGEAGTSQAVFATYLITRK